MKYAAIEVGNKILGFGKTPKAAAAAARENGHKTQGIRMYHSEVRFGDIIVAKCTDKFKESFDKYGSRPTFQWDLGEGNYEGWIR